MKILNLKSLIKQTTIFRLLNPLRLYILQLWESRLSDETYFIKRHKKIFGYKANFANPSTFNEKIIHRILFDRNPLYTQLADKLKARIYIAHKLLRQRERERERERESNATVKNGAESSADSAHFAESNIFTLLKQPINSLHAELFSTNSCAFLPKLYGVWESVDKIEFEKLPKSFVLKTNHDSGGVVLVIDKEAFLKDSRAFKSAMKKLQKHLKTNYYKISREWHYKDIEARVFAEEMLIDPTKQQNTAFTSAPTDYKFHCFCGAEMFYIQVDVERFINHSRAIFNNKWEKMEVEYAHHLPKYTPKQPQNLALMSKIASKLSNDVSYVRVDLYNLCERIFIGELTFTPEGGTGYFNPPKWDKYFGDLWK